MRFSPYELIRFLRETGLPIKQTSRSWVLECPRCHKWKLSLLKNSGRFVCWYCGEQTYYGSAEYALADILGLRAKDIRNNLLNNQYTPTLNLTGISVEEEAPEEFIEETYVWPHNFYDIDHRWSRRGADYLAGRGVPLEIAIKYNVKYCPPNRSVVFPILDQGSLLGWQERITYPHVFYRKNGTKVEIPKSPTAAGCEKANLWMFSDNLIGSDHAILAEGPISAIKADLCGGNICSMGKSISRNQMELLVNWAHSGSSPKKKLYLALDPDAYQQTNQLVREYYPYFELYDMVPPKGDLGDMTFSEVKDLYDSAERIGPNRVFFYIKSYKC